MEEARIARSSAWIVCALISACATQPASPPPAQEPVAAAATPSPVFEAPRVAVVTVPAAPIAPVEHPQLLDATHLPKFDGEHQVVKESLRVARIDLTAPTDDLWQRIRNGFSMPNLDSPLVDEKTAYYAARPEYLKRMFERSRRYMHHIVQELERRGMPTELALLPMVESAFNPLAYSPAHASGLWQFIPGTGRRYELTQNWWFDGRRDIVASTSAALDYLRDIYEMHGDWHLALASYNWGENAVGRAIQKNLGAGLAGDYSSLTMPAETRNYVPKLQALKNIIAEPAKYGVDLTPIPNERYFTTVLTGQAELDVALIARLAEMPLPEFRALNPGFSRHPLMRSAKGVRIVLPSEKVAVFHENLAKHDRASGASTGATRPARVNAPGVHRVEQGDTLSGIALRYGVRLTDLKRWNPSAKVLQIGQRIHLEEP
jgi:membrane-bound lytic murein transglycosylase D